MFVLGRPVQPSVNYHPMLLSNSLVMKKMKFCEYGPGSSSQHFILYNLWMGQINWSVWSWQTFTAQCNVTLYLNGPILKLGRKWSVLNTAPEVRRWIMGVFRVTGHWRFDQLSFGLLMFFRLLQRRLNWPRNWNLGPTYKKSAIGDITWNQTCQIHDFGETPFQLSNRSSSQS